LSQSPNTKHQDESRQPTPRNVANWYRKPIKQNKAWCKLWEIIHATRTGIKWLLLKPVITRIVIQARDGSVVWIDCDHHTYDNKGNYPRAKCDPNPRWIFVPKEYRRLDLNRRDLIRICFSCMNNWRISPS